MKCLSVRQPWAWMILHAGKTVENRTWVPSPALLRHGDRLAIHASKTFDVDGLRWICRNHKELGLSLDFIPIDKSAYPVGCVVGSVEFEGWQTKGGTVFPANNMPPDRLMSPWFFGPVGWLIQDPVELAEPVPTKGRLGLFDVGDEIFRG